MIPLRAYRRIVQIKTSHLYMGEKQTEKNRTHTLVQVLLFFFRLVGLALFRPKPINLSSNLFDTSSIALRSVNYLQTYYRERGHKNGCSKYSAKSIIAIWPRTATLYILNVRLRCLRLCRACCVCRGRPAYPSHTHAATYWSGAA